MTCYRLTTAFGAVEVSLASGAEDMLRTICYEGDEQAVDIIRRRMASTFGRRAMPIDEVAAPIDLELAMGSTVLEPCSPERLA